MKFLRTATVAASLLAATAVNAMDFKIVATKSGNVMLAQGEIHQGDSERMISYMQNNPDLEATNTVMLNSPGGVIDESQWIAKVFRDLHLKTVVPTNGYCVSACFELWASGTTRVAGKGARIGVHRVHINGVETDKTKADTIEYASRVQRLGVPRAILASMMMQKSVSMYYLTDEDMASMGAFRYDDGADVQSARPQMVTPAPAPSFAVTSAPEAAPDAAPVDERTARRIEFDAVYEKATEVSKRQNRGRAAAIRSCDQRGCEEVLGYHDKNGYYVELHKSLNGDSRALCRLVQKGVFEDDYKCKNYLTGATNIFHWSREPLL